MIDNENDALTSYLRDSLDQQSWFNHFSKLRNQMAHRNLTIFQIISGGNTVKIKIPDDPNTTDEMPAYSKNLDLREYCQKTTENVRKVIEDVYHLIEKRLRDTYGIPNPS
jgi:hypothetical protein